MISLYILLIASGVTIFGLIVTIFSYIKKVDRSKRMGHFFLVFGVIIAIIAGFSINKEKEAHQAATFHQKKLQAEQIYDAGLIHISDKQIRIKNGQAKTTIHVSANTTIKIHSSHEQLHDLDYKPIKEKKDLQVTFVMPGRYTVIATRGQNKMVKHITVLKSNHEKITSSSSLSSSEVVSDTSDDTPVSDTVIEDTSSEIMVEPDITESDTMGTTVEDVLPSTDYEPVWTPSTTETTTDTDTTKTEDSTSTDTQTSADGATTETTSGSNDVSNNIGE